MLQHVQRGQLLEAAHLNRIIDAVNSLLPPQKAGPEFRRFELTEDLTPGGSAEVNWQLWHGYGNTYKEITPIAGAEAAHKVYDIDGIWRGREKGKYSSTRAAGSKGLAVYAMNSGQWEIVSMQPSALLIKGTMNGVAVANDSDNLETTDPHCYITVTGIMQPVGGLITHTFEDEDPVSGVLVYNSLQWDGNDGAAVRARWDEAEEQWELDWIDCP
jgi:hypothetical protein